jgi:hypothetical protein
LQAAAQRFTVICKEPHKFEHCRADPRDNAGRMSKKTPWVFVDCEARGTSPVRGVLTEFGAVHYDTRDTFHGRLFDATPHPDNPAISIVGERTATDKDVAESFSGCSKVTGQVSSGCGVPSPWPWSIPRPRIFGCLCRSERVGAEEAGVAR